MTPKELRRRVGKLDPGTPQHQELAAALREGAGYGKAWYRHQKEHWLGWLAEYDGPGAYGRTPDMSRDARYVYNHIQCAPMLFWLAEALQVEQQKLSAAFDAVLAAPKRNASQCAALRRHIPWEDIEVRLNQKAPGGVLSTIHTASRAIKSALRKG
ncbi:hypothetical protein [Paroceanicella profunda]|uniref:hypothetical protein n=1 Tax=Paroceanicella profunda TaxID=2579971 RepID=UPI00197CB6AD|nr:hypothetical protein [Paroceanicella profunda]